MKLRVFVILKNDKNILLVKESNLKWKNKWYFPGGKVKKTENPIKAAIRETKEESGFDIIIDGILFISIIANGTERGTRIFYSGRIISGNIKTFEDEYTVEASWIEIQDVKNLQAREDLHEIVSKLIEDEQLIPESKIFIKAY